MSKTIRNEQTKGFLDKLSKMRKERKAIRAVKADELFSDWDLKAIDFFTPAQQFE